jgi:PTH1 family peptidyl-tRNA hydrolase
MKLIVGLGNPGRKYEQTRHNVGFIVAEKVAVLTSAGAAKVKFEGEITETSIGGEKVAILCPHTFMNASGQSVRKAFDFYKLELSDLLVLCDDLNLASGRLRIRPSGSAGGQNGIKDIIRHLGSEAFPRLRVGIGRPPEGWTVTDYVLGKFSKAEHEKFESATTRAAHAVIDFVTDGVDRVMSRYNVDPDAKPNQPKKQPANDSRSPGEDIR